MIEDKQPDISMCLPVCISDVVKPWVESCPDRPALVEEGGNWTYRELSLAVANTQKWLIDSGVRSGDRVMIVCENCRAFVAILFALAELDAWPVLVNARLSDREVDAIRAHCDPRRVIYTTGVSSRALAHAHRHGAVIIEDASNLGPIGIGPLNERVRREEVSADRANGVAVLIYTSGTTGLPKGIMLTHRNLLYVAAVSAKIRSLTPDDCLYGVLPMSHAVGLSVVLLGTLLSGATLYLSPRFDAMTARTVVEENRLTVFLGVPAMFAQFLKYAKLRRFQSLNFPALRIIASSGAPLQLALKKEVEALFGLVLHNGYGVTECSPTIAQTRIEAPRSDTSVGPVFPGVEIKLVGLDRQPVGEGEVGELWVHGPNVMKGYYRAPQETAAVIDEMGWFNTGDLARLESGNLFVVGRAKDLIVHSGFNVYPIEVEAVLNTHPEVVQSAVIGRSHEGDEKVIAYVQLWPGSKVTPNELAEYAARYLTSYKRPAEILLIPDMPATITGKVVKDSLEKMAM